MYSKLQYISQGESIQEQFNNIQQVLDNGCTWIQLRFKDRSEDQVLPLAEDIRILTQQYHSTLIINDSVRIAELVQADGVHLGLQDTNVSVARSILGNNKLIGGTANTLQHIEQRIEENCNYIGLGPFRFTGTKQKLSPILGLTGYQRILRQLDKEGIPPIYAIGGIQVDDLDEILSAGVYGVAISAALTHSPQQVTAIQKRLN